MSKYTAEQVSRAAEKMDFEGYGGDMLRAYADLLREREAAKAAVPEGWQLVPVEPTHEMCDAPDDVWNPEARLIYQQMLAAAPKPETEGE